MLWPAKRHFAPLQAIHRQTLFRAGMVELPASHHLGPPQMMPTSSHALTSRLLRIAACCYVAILATSVVIAVAAEPQTVRLLTIGNSFSGNAMEYLDELVEAGGHRLVLKQATIGGATMQRHLDHLAAHQMDPKAGLYSDGKSLDDLLAAEPWDFITMQQASIKSHDVANYRPSARQLHDYVHERAPNAEIVFHETWAYRADDPRFQVKSPKSGEPRTQREMYEGLRSAYETIGKELRMRLVPVGGAFIAADEDSTWGYKVMPRPKLDYPAIPPQPHSLHVGWKWTESRGKQFPSIDGHHAGAAGKYLAGCVFYEFLYGESSVGLKFVPPQIDAAYACFLQETAHAVVAARRDERRAPNSSSSSNPERVRVSDDGRGFELADSGRSFVPWGFNYDHDEAGRLIEDYWDLEWPKVEADFREMHDLGANVVRIHLQLGKFLEAPDRPNRRSLARLGDLLKLAESNRLYLDLTGLACYHKQDVPPWYDALDEQARWKAQAVFWEAVASKCAASNAVFCYDLMNEPISPGGQGKVADWLGPALGDKHFVQRIALEARGRERPEIARAWIELLAAAVRKHDQNHLVTVGLVDWSLDRPGLTSGFVPQKVCDPLDFVAVHLYPKSGKVDEAIETLRGFDLGKPIVIEEMFPLGCSLAELDEFVTRSKPPAAGWIGFYWGKRPEEYGDKSIAEAITKSWLEYFVRRAKEHR